MFDKMSVKSRLLVGFSAVLLLILVLALLSLAKMAEMQSHVDEIASDRYPKIAITHDVIENAREIDTYLRDAILLDSAQAEAVIAKIESNRKENSDSLKKLEEQLVTPQEKERMQAISTTRAVLKPGYDKLYQLIRSNDDAAAREYVQNTFAKDNDNLANALAAMAKLQDENMLETQQDAGKNYLETRTSMWLLTFAAIIIGLLLALRIASSMAKGVGLAVTHAQRIADGDLGSNAHQPTPGSHNEIDILLLALESMRSKLMHTVQDIQQNAANVAGSSEELAELAGQVSKSAQQQAESTTSWNS